MVSGVSAWNRYEKLVFNCFPICTYVSTVMGSTFADILVSPGTHEFYVTARRTPKKYKKKKFHIFYFDSKGYYQIASLFDM